MTEVFDRAELDRMETQLSALCDELRQEIEGEKQDVRQLAQDQGEESTSQNQSDVSSDVSIQERALGAQQTLELELKTVEQALQRIAAGAYGTCADCGVRISLDRLRARPQAIRCIDCERTFSSVR